MQTFVFALLKLILHFLSGAPKLLLIPNVETSPNSYFFDFQYEMMNHYQHQKLQHFKQNHYQKSVGLFHQMSFISRYTHTFLLLFFTIVVAPNKQYFFCKNS